MGLGEYPLKVFGGVLRIPGIAAEADHKCSWPLAGCVGTQMNAAKGFTIYGGQLEMFTIGGHRARLGHHFCRKQHLGLQRDHQQEHRRNRDQDSKRESKPPAHQDAGRFDLYSANASLSTGVTRSIV